MSELTQMKLLTITDVAKLLDVSRRTVTRMINDGRLPQPARFSRKMIRWSFDDIMEHIRGLTEVSK